ncbi:MAG: RNA polymerase sigma factor [Streptomycetales bacterium]
MSLPPFDQVVQRHGADVWRFIVSQVGPGRADDVFQDTMLAALAAYPSLRDPAVVRSWLARIAARKAIDLFRTAARAPVPVDDPDPGPAPERELPDEQLWGRVRALPDKQRQAVGLRFVLDLDYRGVGEAMDTTPEAARRNVFEALTALRQHYGDGAAPAERTAARRRKAR